MERKNIFSLLAALLVAALLMGGAYPVSAADERVVTIGITSVWDTFMPLNTTSAHTDAVLEQMFDRLMVINRDGTFEPRLAESWEMNEEMDTITYHLNPEAKWHDGEPVTADDVVFTYRLATDPEVKHMRRIRLMYFAGTDDEGAALSEDSLEIEALDEHTVSVKLKQPMDPIAVYALTNRDIFILPEHLLKDMGKDEVINSDFWQKPIGSGPFKFDSTISGERVEFVANEDYYLGKPDFDRLIIRMMPAANLYAGLKSGEIDIIMGGMSASIPLQDWENVAKDESLASFSIPSLAYQYMSVNTSREYLPQEIRQAMSLAINRDVIINNLLKGQGVPAIGPLPPTHQYFNEEILPIEFDVERAKTMVEEAGWDPNRVLQFLVPQGNKVREMSAPLIQQNLAAIGIKTEIQMMDFPTMLQAARDGEYDLCLIGSAGSLDPAECAPNVTVGYLNNFSQTDDPTIGDLAAKGAASIDMEERVKYFNEYQTTFKEQSPLIFLYFSNELFAYNNSKLANVHPDVQDYAINRVPWTWEYIGE
ncbi:MAG: peptide ABC transporter substrate-binding protein [Eubacteriales bacterium]|nr:peptide ABC transporter substrate-binding protein [Eubacteriales bacterium]